MRTITASFLVSLTLFAQDVPPQQTRTVSIRGTVINSVTREPVGRALVFSTDNRFAMLTDSEGHFEFSYPEAAEGAGNGPFMFSARKPGFLVDLNAEMQAAPENQASKEMELLLVPEALVVGRVTLPTSEAPEPIEVELFRYQVQDGRATWVSRGVENTRSNGEFRFSDLPAGTYKLLSHELPDRDSDQTGRHGPAYAYPPVYYPSAPDFSTAAPILLTAGTTFQAELSLTKRQYYEVKVPVVNPQAGPVNVTVSVQGHKGPGYALGFNERDQTIVGLLPDGHYTLDASSYGATAASGVVNIVVNGAAVEGPRMTLLPDRSIKVNVKEEFTAADNSGFPQGVVASGSLRRINQARQMNYLNLMLQPDDDFGQGRGGNMRSSSSSPDDNSLVIDGVQPGRYWVRVFSSRGFAASVTSGGTDLLHQPLVVGTGGASPPIEVTMRDDAAQIEGTIDGADAAPALTTGPDGSLTALAIAMQNRPFAFVYCVPLPDSPGQFTEAAVSFDGKFTLANLAPGAYRLLAFKRPQPELEYRNPEAMQTYEAKGPVVRLVAGQTEHLRLPLISPNE